MPQQSPSRQDEARMESHSSAVIGHWPVIPTGSPPAPWIVTTARVKQLTGLIEGLLLLALGMFLGQSFKALLLGEYWSNLGFVLTALATQMLVIALPLLMPVRVNTFPLFQGISRERLMADAASILLSLAIVRSMGLQFAPALPLILMSVRLLVGCCRWEVTDLSAYLSDSSRTTGEFPRSEPSPLSVASGTLVPVLAGGVLALALSWTGGFENWPDSISVQIMSAFFAGLILLRPAAGVATSEDHITRPDWPNSVRAGFVAHLMAFAGIVATHCYSIFLGVPFDLGTYVLLAGLAGMALDWGDSLARCDSSAAAIPVLRPVIPRIPWLRIYNASLGLVVYAGMAWFVMHLLPVQSYRN